MFIFFKFSQIQADSIIRHQQPSYIKMTILPIIISSSQLKPQEMTLQPSFSTKSWTSKTLKFRIFSNLNHLNKYDILMSNRADHNASQQSLPQFLIGPLLEVFEVPVWVDMFRSWDLHSFLSHQSKLDLVDWMAVSLVDYGPAPVNDLLAFLSCPFRVPVIGD